MVGKLLNEPVVLGIAAVYKKTGADPDNFLISSVSQFPEETAEQLRAFGLQNVRDDFGAMVEPLLLHQIHQRAAAACLRIGRSEDNPIQAGKHNRTCAHRTRFKRNI